MAERLPTATDPNVNPNQPFLHDSNDPTLRSSTYVVQIPKDQVYRVPPPENALIVERHDKEKAKSCCSCCICCGVFIAIVVIAIGIMAAITIIFLKT
ncbi:hypothetical protein Patl1_08502 [Pistacia atlantica]|uniref:Uncharacterized protein n=1 Tax=Pistacia atlantica TaxID=434234 RepID=A0ACC1AIT1_9ROSI|nr:hypothetical protein Patl1_08502 [Pistacia atlantica]